MDLQNEPKWLVLLADFEILNVVLLLNFILVSENHITVVAVKVIFVLNIT